MNTDSPKFLFPKRERGITRFFAFLLGILFVVGAPASSFFHPNQRSELAHASAGFLAAVIATCLVCAAVGAVFIAIGVKGSLPLWLAKRLSNAEQ